MADTVGLHDLVGSVASAIVDAQAIVERRYVDQIGRYFDATGKPVAFALKLPSAAAGAKPTDSVDVCVPLLALTESSMLAIAELRIDLEVELGGITTTPDAPLQAPRAAGAPVDVPAIDPLPAAAPGAAPAPAAAPAAPAKVLAVGIGAATGPGPRATLSIKVEARPPSDGMVRLLTQLNKLI